MRFRRSRKGINASLITIVIMLILAFQNHQKDGYFIITLFFVFVAAFGLHMLYIQAFAPFLKITESEIEITLLKKRKISIQDIVQLTENEHHNYVAQLNNGTSELLQLNQLETEDLKTVLGLLSYKGIQIHRVQST